MKSVSPTQKPLPDVCREGAFQFRDRQGSVTVLALLHVPPV